MVVKLAKRLIFHRRNVEGELSGVGVWISMQDYKSPCAGAIICGTLVNAQKHTHNVRQLLTNYEHSRLS